MVSEISTAKSFGAGGGGGGRFSNISAAVRASEISVDLCPQNFCGSSSQKSLWILVSEISVDRCPRNFCGSFSQKCLWILVSEISVDRCPRNFCGSLSQKFLRGNRFQRNFCVQATITSHFSLKRSQGTGFPYSILLKR